MRAAAPPRPGGAGRGLTAAALTGDASAPAHRGHSPPGAASSYPPPPRSSRSARPSTSPAPSVSSRSPSAQDRAEQPLGVVHRGGPVHAPAARGAGGRRGHEPAAHARVVLGALAGRVDVEHADDVGQRQRPAELARQHRRARVEVRLEARDHAPRRQRPRRLERGAHLGRVVGVVVVHLGARPRCARAARTAAARPRSSRAPAPPRPPARPRRGRRPARRARSARCGGPAPAAEPRRRRPRSATRRPPARRPARPGRPPRCRTSRPPPPPRAAPPTHAAVRSAPAANSANACSISSVERYVEWWSSSTFVTTASAGASLRNERSDSSASTTSHSPLPQSAFVPVERSSPPIRYDGSRPSSTSTCAAMLAVVVFPCVPATATHGFSRDTSPSRSPRWSTALRQRARRRAPGCPRRSPSRPPPRRPPAGWRRRARSPALDPGGAQPLAVRRLGAVGARHLGAQRARDERQAAHPGAADPDEVQPPAGPWSAGHSARTLAARALW